MEYNNKIIKYTAADIEKYWQGKLPPAEMHAIEKAAMDDPFLADALEGYRNTTTTSDDLLSLREKLDRRTMSLVSIINLKRKKYTWLRVAAAIIIISGIGLLVQQLVFKNKGNLAPLVNIEKKDTIKNEATSNKQTNSDTLQISKSGFDSLNQKVGRKPANKLSNVISEGNTAFEKTKNEEKEVADKKQEDANVVKAESPVAAEPNAKTLNSPITVEAISKQQLDSTKKDYEVKSKAAARQQNYDGYMLADKDQRNLLSNRYNYRVVDAQNNPVPFANVTNTRDNVGTYTDIRGSFNLISADSTLNVQIRSLGYSSANYKLIPSAKQNDLVLKEDDQTRREILAQNRKLVSNVTRKDSTELEEPEVGWGNYNTYIANNIQIPDNIRAKNSRSDVELSFDIDRAGNPINIKVTKSSQCKACDDEAIRLLKEGPKWKRKGKKSKTTISIAVDQK